MLADDAFVFLFFYFFFEFELVIRKRYSGFGFRYVLAIAILSTLYTGLQVFRQVHELSTGREVFSSRRNCASLDFFGDQVVFFFPNSSLILFQKHMTLASTIQGKVHIFDITNHYKLN